MPAIKAESQKNFVLIEMIFSLSFLIATGSESSFPPAIFSYLWGIACVIVSPIIFRHYYDLFYRYELVTKLMLFCSSLATLVLPWLRSDVSMIAVSFFIGLNFFFYFLAIIFARADALESKRRLLDLITPIKFSSEVENKNCSICICDFAPEDKIIKLKGCGHLFHDSCFSDFFIYNSGKTVQCPVCRFIVFIPTNDSAV